MGVIACIVLIIACFLPWTFHADVNKDFTGFLSEKDTYGKPGKVFIFLAVLSVILLFVQKVWAKRMHIFVAGLIIAYAIKTYILYTSCYNAYCPDKRYGIYLVILSAIFIMLSAVFPDTKLPEQKNAA